MTRTLTVKREIRSLGLDLCVPGRVLGAVVRGGLYLDGIVVLTSGPKFKTRSVAAAILATRFYPELRLIMSHDPSGRIDPTILERLTELPMIQVVSSRDRKSSGLKEILTSRGKLLVKSNLLPKTLQEILSTTWTMGTLPEPLRLAHILAKSRNIEKTTSFRGKK